MKIALMILCLLAGFSTYAPAAEDSLSVNSEGSSTADIPVKAREESLADALNKGTLQAIGNLVGETRLEKSMPVIKTKILSQRQRFIQYYKASEPLKKGNETVTTVNMRISVSSLRDILAKEGILYQSEGPATILPVIRMVEKRDNSRGYYWWTEEASQNNAFLREQEKTVLHQLENVFRPKNFFLIDPLSQHYVQWVPQPYRSDNPTIDDLLWMGDFFKAQMIISGDVVLEPGSQPNTVRSTVKLTAYSSQNGRVVAEVTRTIENPSTGDWELGVQQNLKKGFSEIAKDLGSQVFDEWTKGTLGASLLKLAVHGNFGFQDLENFKKQIMAKVGDIKKIRERRLEQGTAVFEVDTNTGLNSLTKTLQTAKFDGFQVSVANAGTDKLDINWAKK